MNTLFLVGLAIFLGVISSKFLEKVKVPSVVGYIIVGLLIGKSFFHLFEENVVHSLTMLVNFTLGIIGCVIGSELKADVFRKYGRSIYTMLVAEGVLAFVAVTAVVTLLTGKLYLGLLLGAIASATDPASTVSVLWENKSKGPLTTTVTAIVALDDALALIIYGLVVVFAKSMIVKEAFSFWSVIGVPLLEIAESLVLGAGMAFVLVKTIKHIREESLALSFIMGTIAVIAGLALYFQLDLILTSMAFGATVANVLPRVSERLFGKIKDMTTPLYILFFVVVGAQLDIHIFMQAALFLVVMGYLVARSLGKILGAMLGGHITHARKTVTRYTGICLFTQGGVAIGLAISINNHLSHFGPEGVQAGLLVTNIIAATTFVVQLLGPPLVRFAVRRADEAFRNVTREDIIETLKAADVMARDIITLQEGLTLKEVIDVLRDNDISNFPVVDKAGHVVGLISLKELKEAILRDELAEIVLAKDIAVASPFMIYPQQPLTEVTEMFEKRDMEFLPVIEKNNSQKVVGLIERPSLQAEIDRRLLERQNMAEDTALQLA